MAGRFFQVLALGISLWAGTVHARVSDSDVREAVSRAFAVEPTTDAETTIRHFDPSALDQVLAGLFPDKEIPTYYRSRAQFEYAVLLQNEVERLLDPQWKLRLDQVEALLSYTQKLTFVEVGAFSPQIWACQQQTLAHLIPTNLALSAHGAPLARSLRTWLDVVQYPLPSDPGTREILRRAQRDAAHSLLHYAFALGDPGLAWMKRFRLIHRMLEKSKLEDRLSVVRDFLMPATPRDPRDLEADQIQRAIRAVAGKALEDRLATIPAGKSNEEKAAEFMLTSPPLASERFEITLREQWQILLDFVHARQKSYGPWKLDPELEPTLHDRALKSGYRLSLRDDGTALLKPHRLSDLGPEAQLPVLLRRLYRKHQFADAESVLNHFDFRHSPRVETAFPAASPEDSLKVAYLQHQASILSEVVLSELELALPQFFRLSPTPDQVRRFLEIPNYAPYDLAESPICIIIWTRIQDRATDYLKTVPDLESWRLVAEYRYSSDFSERLHYGSYNYHFFEAVRLGDSRLSWIDQFDSSLINPLLEHPFSSLEILRSAFAGLDEEDREEPQMISQAVAQIVGNFLKVRTTELVAAPPAAFEAVLDDNSEASEDLLLKATEQQRFVLLRYLEARQRAGAKITVPRPLFQRFVDTAEKLAVHVRTVSQTSDAVEVQLTLVFPRPTLRERWGAAKSQMMWCAIWLEQAARDQLSYWTHSAKERGNK